MVKKKETFRIERRGNKLFKVRQWDNLSFKKYKIVSRSISIGGIPIFKKNKAKWIRNVKKHNLQDFVIGKEIKNKKR